jgi:hypothetical protein
VFLAALSYACVIGFVQTMIYIETNNMGPTVHSAVLSGGILMVWAWGFALYRIGQAAAYWSPAIQRGWRLAGWFALALFLLSLVTVMLEGAALWLRHT